MANGNPSLEALGAAQRGLEGNRDEVLAFAAAYHEADLAGFGGRPREAYRGVAQLAVTDALAVAGQLGNVGYDSHIRYRRELPQGATEKQKKGNNNLTSPTWNLLDLPSEEGADALLLSPEGQLFRGMRTTTDRLANGERVDGYRGVRQLYTPNGRPIAPLDGIVTPHLVRVSLAHTLVRKGLI